MSDAYLKIPILLLAVTLVLGSCGGSTVVISGDVDTPETAYARGLQLLDAGDLERARASFEHARELDADYAAALEGLSRVAHAEGNTNEAIRHIQTAKITDGKYAPAWIFTGILYNSVNRHKDALMEYQEALNRDPDDLWTVITYYEMARTYERMDRPRDAYNAFAEVLKRDALHMPSRAGQERVRGDLPPGFFNPFRD